MYTHVCIHVYMCVYIYIYTHMYIHTHTCCISPVYMSMEWVFLRRLPEQITQEHEQLSTRTVTQTGRQYTTRDNSDIQTQLV